MYYLLLDSGSITLGGRDAVLPKVIFNVLSQNILFEQGIDMIFHTQDSIIFTSKRNMPIIGGKIESAFKGTSETAYDGRGDWYSMNLFTYVKHMIGPLSTISSKNSGSSIMLIENYDSGLLLDSLVDILSSGGFHSVLHVKSDIKSINGDIRLPLLHLLHIVKANVHKSLGFWRFGSNHFTLLVSYNSKGILDFISLKGDGFWHTVVAHSLPNFKIQHEQCPNGCIFEIEYVE
ncbi:MAG: hypothetical protein OCD76_03355 [Reichenbachiella sp.]